MITYPHIIMPLLLFLVLVPLGLSGAYARAPADEPIRVLVVTGGHDYETSFYTVFEAEDIAWDHAVSNETAFRQDIRGDYDVLVLYDMTRELSETGRENLRNFVEDGNGLVVLHHAILDYDTWPWWYRDVVGGKYVAEEEDTLRASTYQHDVTMSVEPVRQHPVTSGIEKFEIEDETYKHMWISPQVDVLLRTDHPTSDGPIAWISPYDRSRVVYIQLGHGRPAHLHSAFRQLVRQAIAWAAEGVE